MKSKFNSPFKPKIIKNYTPNNLKIFTFHAGFKKRKHDLLLLVFDKITQVAALYSKTSTPSAPIIWDKKNNDGFSYEIKGNVKDTNINLIGDDNLKKINFNFDIQDKVYNFDNIIFEYQNINYQSKKISIVNSGRNFEIGGILNSAKGLIKPNLFSKLFNINLDILDEKEKLK